MSIVKMISEHPDVDGHLNDPLAEAVRKAMQSAAICNSCADACTAESDVASRVDCIRACMDCADICTTTMRVAARRAGENVAVIRSMLELCITACNACIEHCGHHDDDHCKRCAAICEECVDACQSALATL